MPRIASFMSVLVLAGCASTANITHTWVAEDIDEKDLEGVLVLAISDKADARRRFERRFTDALQERGVRAVASYEHKGGGEISKEDIIAIADKVGVEALLVTTFAGKDQHEVLHPGRTYYGLQPIYNRGYYGRGRVYGAPYEVAHVPDFYAVHKSVHLEANLYAIASEEHLWLAASGVEESDDVDTMLNAFVSAFVKQLAEQGLVH